MTDYSFFKIAISASKPASTYSEAIDKSNWFINESAEQTDGLEVSYIHFVDGKQEVLSTKWIAKNDQKYGEIKLIESEPCYTACSINYSNVLIYFSCILSNESGTKTMEVKNAVAKLMIKKR